MGHTFSVLDEEIHVPGWVDAPPGTLSDAERAQLVSKRHEPLTHVDLTQTILDLIGVHDAPEIQPYLSLTSGVSLLRPGVNEQMMTLTNCAGVWSCAFENWGVIQGWRKVQAREWDTRWRCHDLRSDPKEQKDLGEAACADLIAFAKAKFTRLPGRVKHAPEHPRDAVARR